MGRNGLHKWVSIMLTTFIVALCVLLWILVYVCIQYDKLNDFLYKSDIEAKRMKEEHMRMHLFYNRKSNATISNNLSRFDSIKRRL